MKRLPVKQVPVGESLTQQHFAKDADINTIVTRHMRGTGRSLSNIGAGGTRKPIFGDFSSLDYHTMLNKVTDIDNTFRRLSGKMRARFRNDPYQLLRFTEDPANLRECVKLGLVALPEGQVMTESGDIVDQEDLVEQSKNEPQEPEMQKADPEANPHKKA